MKKIIFLFLTFLFSYYSTYAQGLQIGISAKPLISYPGFDESYVYQAIRYQPLPSRALGIMLRSAITPRWNLETGFSSIQLGYRMNYVRNYVAGQRITHNILMSQLWSMFEIPMGVQYKISKPLGGNPHRKWCFSIHAGANLFISRMPERAFPMFSTTLINSDFPDDTKMVIDRITEIKSFRKLNPYFKISMERKLGKSQYFSLGLIHHQGLSVMYDTRVSYTAQGQDFENHIYTRGSYTGLQIVYFFTLIKGQE